MLALLLGLLLLVSIGCLAVVVLRPGEPRTGIPRRDRARSVGWGPHNRNPSVLYLERERVVGRVDPRAAVAAAAVERRRREQDTDEAA